MPKQKPDPKLAVQSWVEGFAKVLPPEDYAKLQQMFDPSKLPAPAMDYAANGVMLRNDYNRNNAQLNSREAALNQREQQIQTLERQQAEYDQQIQEWESHLESNTVSRAEFSRAQTELAALREFKDQANARLSELGVGGLLDDLEPEGTDPTNPYGQSQNPTPGQAQNGNGHKPNQVHRTTSTRVQPPQPPEEGEEMPNQNPTQNGNRQSPVRYVTVAQHQQSVNEAALSGTLVAAQLLQLQQEYLELTGKPLPNAAQLVKEAVQNGIYLTDYIEGQLNIPALRLEAANKAREAEIEKEVNKRLGEMATSQRLPGLQTRNDYYQSPIVENLVGAKVAAEGQDPLSSKPNFNRKGEGARRAAEAFNQRKYQNGVG